MRRNLAPRLLKALFVACIAGTQVAPATAYPTPAASDYYIAPFVSYGEALTLEFRFSEPAVASSGPANMLILDMGSFGTATGVRTELYAGGALLGTAQYSGGGLLAIFQAADSPYALVGPPVTVPSDLLNNLLSGLIDGVLRITPTFSDPDGFVGYSGWGPHAARGLGPTTFEDVFPIAAISDAKVASIPEPESWLLLVLGLGVAWTLARYRHRPGARRRVGNGWTAWGLQCWRAQPCPQDAHSDPGCRGKAVGGQAHLWQPSS